VPVLGAPSAAFQPGDLHAFEAAKLVAADGAAGDRFGTSVAIHGTTLVVGEPYDNHAGSWAGAAYVFVRSGSSWVQAAKLTASDAAAWRFFGQSVSIHGDRIAVGSPAGFNVCHDGNAYVFVRNGTQWFEEAILPGPHCEDGGCAGFGSSVSIWGDSLVVGAPQYCDGYGAWSAYERVGASWTPNGGDSFILHDNWPRGLGSLVSLSGDTCVVGTEDAKTFFYSRQSPQGWHRDFQVTGFGGCVSGDTAAINLHVPAGSPGMVRVLVGSGTTWSEQALLTASDGIPGNGFGAAVSVDGDRIVVGARGDDDAGPSSGSAYVFVRSGTTWSEEEKLTASDGEAQDVFGRAVAIHGDATVVGAPFDDDAGVDAGAAYAFRLFESDPFCDASDGSHASCPCANAGLPDAGCDIAQGTGGVRLEVVDQDDFLRQATLRGSGFAPASAPTVLVLRSSALDPSAPVVFGDGLRCVGAPVVRAAPATAQGGTSLHLVPHGAMAGLGTFYYQLWFRDAPASFCDPSAAFNLSGGKTLVWAP
jgi:hypothetical protein